jgi:hypothetical protein
MADSVASYNIGSNATLASGTRDQSGDGAAIVAAPGAGKSVVVKELYFWLIDPDTEVTVTPKLGSALTLPPVKLTSARSGFSIYRAPGEHIRCAANSAVSLNLSDAVAIGVMCLYDVV